jgi:hypothetical protein
MKRCDDSKWHKIRIGILANGSNCRDSLELSINRNHLAVKIGKSSESKVTMSL